MNIKYHEADINETSVYLTAKKRLKDVDFVAYVYKLCTSISTTRIERLVQRIIIFCIQTIFTIQHHKKKRKRKWKPSNTCCTDVDIDQLPSIPLFEVGFTLIIPYFEIFEYCMLVLKYVAFKYVAFIFCLHIFSMFHINQILMIKYR